MRIQIDTREKPHAIKKILRYFDTNNIPYFKKRLDQGDYVDVDSPNKVVIDRKQNLSEVCSNLTTDHERFVNECKRSQEAGETLIILVEHGSEIRSIEDVKNWINPRTQVQWKTVNGRKIRYVPSKYATQGDVLYKIMQTVATKYDVTWVFCTKRDTGKRIIELLSGN